MLTSIDGKRFCQMIICGANNLEEHKQTVDEMNVFPVPDGDTGTNMSMTVMSAAREVLKNQNAAVPEMAKALSSGALRGARGNSGVIVSQLFRGMYRGLRDYPQIDTGRFAEAMRKGVETAYKAVMRPKEGTILTVAREMADFAIDQALHTEDIEELLENTIEQGWEVLKRTPEMLTVLKEAGVVDADGQGFLYIVEGMLQGARLPEGELPALESASSNKQMAAAADYSAQAAISTESITFGYCTEFIIDGVENAESHEEMLREYLSSIGDSLVVVADEDLIKIHVHTNDPGLAIQKGLSLGSLSSIKIDNMRLQHRSTLEFSQPQKQPAKKEKRVKKETGFITISVGDGISSLFTDLGVDEIIPGGQTMNPSTEDILTAIEKVYAENVIVLPNNKNIILAAQQAAELTEDKKVYVVESKSIPQGITAMLNYGAEGGVEKNVEAMRESLSTVKTGQITFAVRDTHIGEFEIHKDNMLAIIDGEVSAVGEDLLETSKELLNHMMEDEPELVTFYTGEEADEAVSDQLQQYMEETYPETEVEFHEGGQPLYYYIISAE